MAAETLDRPGVEVIQEFARTSPTILKPTMPACIVGPANQVVEAVDDSGTLVGDAVIGLPGRIAFSWVTTPFTYANVGGATLAVSVNNAAVRSVAFAGSGAKGADTIVSEIKEAAVPGLDAVVEVSGSQKRVVIYTTLSGDNANLRIDSTTSSALLTSFGITAGYASTGRSGYTNFFVFRPLLADYPDPRSNLDELVVDYDTVRVFVADGAGSFREALTTETFLDGAVAAVTVQDDGDGDNLSPYINVAGAVFANAAAVLTGTVDLTTLTYGSGGTVDGLDLVLSIDGAAGDTTTFATPANAAAVVSQINTAMGATVASLDGSNRLVLTSPTKGQNSSVEVLAGSTAGAGLGTVIGAYAAGKPSRARAQGITDLTSLTYATGVQGRVLKMSIDGEDAQTIVFSSSVTTSGALITAINALWGTIASVNGANQLVLKSKMTNGGVESSIRIDKTASDATLLTNLGLTGAGAPFNTVSEVYGEAFAPEVGDELWVDGLRLGEITEVVVSPTNRLRIDTEKLLSFTGSNWYIVAKALDNAASTASRPSSDLIVDENSGTILVKPNMFRGIEGTPTDIGPLNVYVAYTALRLDVSPAADSFSILRFGTTTDLDAALAPIDTSNPLALGLYFALLNAPGIEVTGVGVGETSSTEPEGTAEGYAAAFEYLESKDVYAIAPMTHSSTVGQIGQVHVGAMSEPENRQERALIFCPSRPTRSSDTLIASGAKGNVSGAPTNVINTGIANLQALLAAAGVPGPTFTEDDAVYLELEDDTNKYLIESVSGAALTINDGPLSADNTEFLDNNGTEVFTAAIVDRPFSIKILGSAVANRTEEAIAYANIGRGFKDRRVIVVAPDKAKAVLDSLETLIPGYYLGAALAGKISAKAPQQPLTEESLAGFTGLQGSNDRYGELQLKIMDGGGLFVFYHEGEADTPVMIRHQLTSDVSTVEKRELSILTAVDFGAKFMRSVLRNFIGRFNITTNVVDAVTTVAEGASSYLVRTAKVFSKFQIEAIRQSATNPDWLELDVDVGVLYPLNKIRVTMVI